MESFSHEATHFASLAAMVSGGMGYRFGKMVGLQIFSPLFSSSIPRFMPTLLAPVMGLAVEVSAFQSTTWLLQGAGEQTFGESWRNSFVDFAMMKGVGHLLRSSNVILQHFSQDFSMVLGHQSTAFLGWTTHPKGSFLDQMLQAEIMNFQLAVGNHLSARLTGHALHLVERSIEHGSARTALSFQRISGRSIPQMASDQKTFGEAKPDEVEIGLARGQSQLWEESVEGNLRERITAFRRQVMQGDTLSDALRAEYQSLSTLMDDFQLWQLRCDELREKVEEGSQWQEIDSRHLEYCERAIQRIYEGSYLNFSEHLVEGLKKGEIEDAFWGDEIKRCLSAERQVVSVFAREILHSNLVGQRFKGLMILCFLHEYAQEAEERMQYIPPITAAIVDKDVNVRSVARSYSEHLQGEEPSLEAQHTFTRELAKIWGPLHQLKGPFEKPSEFYEFVRKDLSKMDEAPAQELYREMENALAGEVLDKFWQSTAVFWIHMKDARRLERYRAMIPAMGAVGSLFHISMMGDVLAELPEPDRNECAEKMMNWLRSDDPISADYAERILRKNVGIFSGKTRINVVVAIVNYYDRRFMNFFPFNARELAKALDDKERVQVFEEVLKIFKSSPNYPRYSSIVAAFIRSLPTKDCMDALDIADEWVASHVASVQHRGNLLHRYLIPYIPISMRMARATSMMQYAMRGDLAAFDNLAHAFKYLPPQERLVFYYFIESYPGEIATRLDALQLMSTHLNRGERLNLIRKYGQSSITQVDQLILLHDLSIGLSADELRHQASIAQTSMNLGRILNNLAICVEANIPPSSPGLFTKFDQNPEVTARRVATLDRMSRGYVAGELGSVRDSNVAFAALGHTLLHHNAEFEKTLKRPLPDAFIGSEDAFEFEVAGAASAHQILDKGILENTMEPLATAADLDQMRRLLVRILTTNKGSARREVRAFALKEFSIKNHLIDLTQQKKFIEEALQDETRFARVTERLYRILSSNPGADAQRRADAQVLFLSRLLHAQPQLLTRVREAISHYQEMERNENEEGIPSVLIEKGYEALHEFYSQDYEGLDVAESLFVSKMLVRLDGKVKEWREAKEKVSSEVHHVRVLPIKQGIDQYFGFLGEDCNHTKIDKILSKNFQTARLIVDGQWLGMVYIQLNDGKPFSDWEADAEENDRVIHIAFAPRRKLNVNVDQLVRGIAEGFKEIAKRKQYRAVLISSDRLEQGNLPDVRQSIVGLNLREIEFAIAQPVIICSSRSLVYYEREVGNF